MVMVMVMVILEVKIVQSITLLFMRPVYIFDAN
jgi:hypothetical protein